MLIPFSFIAHKLEVVPLHTLLFLFLFYPCHPLWNWICLNLFIYLFIISWIFPTRKNLRSNVWREPKNRFSLRFCKLVSENLTWFSCTGMHLHVDFSIETCRFLQMPFGRTQAGFCNPLWIWRLVFYRLTLKWPWYFHSRWCPRGGGFHGTPEENHLPTRFCNEIYTICVCTIKNLNSKKKKKKIKMLYRFKMVAK